MPRLRSRRAKKPGTVQRPTEKVEEKVTYPTDEEEGSSASSEQEEDEEAAEDSSDDDNDEGYKPPLGKKQRTGSVNNKEESKKNREVYPCGACCKEVSDEDEGIYCESGCERWFHRTCVGLTKVAFQLLNNEDYAEWACDQCIETKMVPSVKMAAT